MKKPRLTDFDPDAKVPQLASPLDGYPPITKRVVAVAQDQSASQKKKPLPKGNNKLDSMNASKLASMIASTDIVSVVRKAVRQTGKEVSFIRLAREEKQQLGDIVYTYKRQGIKTSENEINRIAVNYLLEDYRLNGANSILQRVMEALLA
jgi:hypothetical protein